MSLVEKRMFLLVLFALMFSTYIGGTSPIGFNKTVGWKWDINNWIFFFKNGSWLFFLIGYGILSLLKYATHKRLSILHLILILSTLIIKDILNYNSYVIIVLYLISIVIFFMNLIKSLKHQMKISK